MKTRALAANLALALGVMAVMLGVAEMVLRRLAPVRTRFYIIDERVLYRPRPGAEQTFTYPHLDREQSVTLRFNRQGYRGEDLPPTRPARRVAVFGDSFVEARLARLERTFPLRLAARLGQALGAPVDAVNAGVSGYGPDQELLRMEGELPALAPQLVVVVLYAGNDGGDLVRNGLFRLDGDRLVANDWRMDEEMRRALAPSRGMRGLALVRALSRAREWARARVSPPPSPPASIDAALSACRQEYALRRADPRHVQSLQADHYDADLSLDPGSPEAAYKRRLLRAAMARLREVAASAHVPLLLVFVPHPTDAWRGWPQQVDAARYPAYRRSALTDVLEQAAQAEGIAFVNLFTPFWDCREALYFPRDGHWNIEGQDLAARLAAEHVLAEGWLR